MFSIIIPLYNKSKYIKFTIESVLNQTFTNFELIIINDGSTDNSLKIIQEEFTDPRIVIVDQSNQGVSAARNNGIQHARYKYIAFLDGDDFWSPSYLEECYQTIQTYQDAVIIGCIYEVVSEHKFNEGEQINNVKPYLIKEYFKYAHQTAMFSSSSTIVKTEILKTLGGFNPKIIHGEDIDMWFRIMMLNKEAVFIPVRLAYYYIGDPTQAMFTLPSLKNHLVGNIFAMYSSRPENSKIEYFEIFLEKYVLKNLRAYYVDDEYKIEVENILQEIKKWHLPYGLFYLIPRNLAKYLYNFVKKIK